MRVQLLSPYPQITNIATTQYPPLGLLYIGANVCDVVDELQILDANILMLNIRQTIERIKKYKPDVLGISVNVVTAKIAREIAVIIKKDMPEVKLIAGGPSPTIHPTEWLRYFDVVIAGEGEIPFRNIIEQLKDGNNIVEASCAGICIKDHDYKVSEHPDLDKLPFPAYDYLIPNLQYYSKTARVVKSYMAPILTSRGCPYGCVFCDKSVHGRNFRPRSAESVLHEIRWLHDKYGIRQLDILDDNFTFDMERATKILDGIITIDKFAINCQNGIRADRINEQLAKKMKRAGVFRAGIGIESGSSEVLNKLNKQLDLNDVMNAIKILRSQRITAQGYFIIGFPYEEKKNIIDTVNFAIKANPHLANFSHFFPIVGTPIYDMLKKEGKLLFSDGEVEDGFYRTNTHIESDKITRDEMSKIYRWAWRKFYFRPSKIFDVIFCIKSWKEFIWIMRIALSMIRNNLLKY